MAYSKTEWKDHIVDTTTGEVIQEGTPVSARNLNNMETGIYDASESARINAAAIADLKSEVEILKNASLNNLTNNVFLENFSTLDAIKLSNGIYDTAAKRLYV
ncbi:hypothetical protein PMI08_01927 [Brevibacillus sp. CF112]|uniref:hypothetical protein n=1 Tax=Brevibacillus TaxID=55080 RepID=UPI0002719093|nr:MULTISPECIES: hypothetical protein [Brevibacillus]EJL44957.1 hypothetical protein PMI08_01927 [Brevibacillus sp. CF112]MBG9567430.1 inorganic polyphosphate kinase [Brevibacillus agri]MBY0054540.1 inorganic polyphosphate kinase [Brevibacillus agri]MDR9503420.1 inorganic polyphosphate kinase [Brevibacillus agri]